MKKLFSLLLTVAIAFSLAGCSSKKNFDSEIYIFLPGEYISDDMIAAFEEQYNIRVNKDLFDSNESMYTKLLGGSTYDILIPSDYMIEKLIAEDMLQKIDTSALENYDDLDAALMNREYDPNNEYSVPYFWGNVGIVYDHTKIDQADVESQGWSVLANPKYKGLLYMYDSERDSFMIALKSLGYSVNTTNKAELDAAYQWLAALDAATDPAYVTDDAIDGLANCTDGKYMGVMYSGDAAYILSENANMRYWAPTEGTNYWVDAMVIHKDAKNVEGALKFIDFVISYDSQVENSSYVGYSAVNKEALDTLAKGEYAGNDAYTPREQTAKDEVFHACPDDIRAYMSDLWIKVKSSTN